MRSRSFALRLGGANRLVILPIVLLAAQVMNGCDGNTASVTAAVSVDQRSAVAVLDRFEQESGLRVDAVYDTESAKTSGLVAIVRAGAPEGRIALWWSGECYSTASLADDGLLAPISADLLAELDPHGHRQSDQWLPVASRLRVLAWRDDVTDPPSDWLDLANPRFDRRIAMADPRFGTVKGHLGAMKAWLDSRDGAGAYLAWCRGVAANHPLVVTSGNAGAVQAVLRGEADFCATDSDDVACATASGVTLHSAALRHSAGEGEGPLLISGSVALLNGAVSTASLRLLRCIASDRTGAQVAGECGGYVTSDPTAVRGLAFPPDPLAVSPAAAAREMDAAVSEFMQCLRAAGMAGGS